MIIKFFEIANFRKLLSVRVDLAERQTLFVGANNSGKSSAMLALRRFLIPRRCPFDIHDFTLCHWPAIDKIGQSWIDAKESDSALDLTLEPWLPLLPTLDLWLDVDVGEMHHVRDLIPTLDWDGGLLGVRLRYEPENLGDLYKDFLAAAAGAKALRAAATQAHAEKMAAEAMQMPEPKLTLWPSSLVDYLRRELSSAFSIRTFSLDPAGLQAPLNGQARPQLSPAVSPNLEGDPLKGLIRIHDIPAQRGFGEEAASSDEEDAPAGAPGSRLSEQLRSYYSKHLDPTKGPDVKDLGALQAIEAAQDAFDQKLTESFQVAFSEVEGMGYPGVTDPKPRVSTRLKAIDGLNHSTAITFVVDVTLAAGETALPVLHLPENNNGLGYQNLISMIFRLLSFRDSWMRVGKAASVNPAAAIEPLHLVLVEEPEAHLHAQVQQVFINKAYEVLRAHPDLKDSKLHRTQLVVSTHSSHVAHEVSFECLRYFRRLPAGMVTKIPVSTVINLTEVFGTGDETARFVTRYLRAQHADLFFADAAILVEGPAERILVPNFIRQKFNALSKSYITVLEIGGSHAHRLKPLIEHLGLLTLIITDLDSQLAGTTTAAAPRPGAGQTTSNTTLRQWVPAKTDIDTLWGMTAEQRTLERVDDPLFAIRAAYQMPVDVTLPGAGTSERAYPYTFEDALVFENPGAFAALPGAGLVARFREAINQGGGAAKVGLAMFEALRSGKKAEFALDVLNAASFETLVVPRYIAEGLTWLQERIKKKQVESLPTMKEAAA
ncbi:MAG: AAA family ATPase [Pseudomonadota bacterium]|nr:AAA family ATPase [Pseudomonadota bacterium]